MTDRQRKFIDEYRISGNATRAAIRAGYSEHTARSQGQRLLTKADVVERLRELGEQDHDVKVANAREVLEYLTSVLRGESRSEVIVVEGAGDGVSEARPMQKAPDEKDRLKAAELLAKRYGLLTDVQRLSLEPVTITNDLTE